MKDGATTADLVDGLQRLLAGLGRNGGEHTFRAFDMVLSGHFGKKEWDETIERAMTDRSGRTWFSPGDLLAIRDEIRKEVSSRRPSEEELDEMERQSQRERN